MNIDSLSPLGRLTSIDKLKPGEIGLHSNTYHEATIIRDNLIIACHDESINDRITRNSEGAICIVLLVDDEEKFTAKVINPQDCEGDWVYQSNNPVSMYTNRDTRQKSRYHNQAYIRGSLFLKPDVGLILPLRLGHLNISNFTYKDDRLDTAHLMQLKDWAFLEVDEFSRKVFWTKE